MYPFYFLALTIVSSLLQINITDSPIIETLLQWFLFFNVGLQGVYAFIGHFFLADEVARGIGWPEGNPFQTEVAFTNLAFGVLGLLSLWIRGDFWTAIVIGRSIFLLGAAYTHIKDIIQRKNFNIYNAGPVLWLSGLLFPATMIVLLLLLLLGY